jgi:hypothetical protein
MTVYDKIDDRATPDADTAARPHDPRLDAFKAFLASIDDRDWRAGQLATRRLRALGLSVCLIKPSDDRRPVS